MNITEIQNKIIATKKFTQDYKTALAFAAGCATAAVIVYLNEKNQVLLKVPDDAVDRLRDGELLQYELEGGTTLTLDYREKFQNRN